MGRRGEYNEGYEASSEIKDERGEFPKRKFMSWEESKYLLKISGNRVVTIVTILGESGGSATEEYSSGDDDDQSPSP